MFEPPPYPQYFSSEHEAYRAALRRFVEREISPFVAAWDEAGTFPRQLYRRAAEVGLLGVGYPEAFGGTPGDEFFKLIAAEEVARAGSGGVQASLCSHGIALPPLIASGDADLCRRVVPPVLAGEKIAALAITEPSGGSDVASLRTAAVRDGDHYAVSGEKVYITSGMRADFFTVAVRTDPSGRGPDGISLLLVEGDRPGIARTELKKMGWWASDTAQLHFDRVRVPVANRIGEEGQGFKAIMRNFNSERLMMSVMACTYAQVCLEEAAAWAGERCTFGHPLSGRQVIRHKLMEMAARIDAARALAYDVAYAVEHGLGDPAQRVARTCLLKNTATRTMQYCADQAVQILGGMGFVRGTKAERLYREAKVFMIGGGAEEILFDLAARQYGL